LNTDHSSSDVNELARRI